MSPVAGVLNPWGATALLAVGVLVALHLWDRRRAVVPVSTLLFWRQLPAAPLERRRRIRPDVLLLARIAAMLALAASLVRPWAAGPDAGAAVPARIIVLDVSASMQTRESAGTRFALAQRRAAGFIATGGETMLVAAATRPRVLLRWTSDATLVRRRLEALDPLDVATRLDAALALALAEARARPGARIAVLTDESRAGSRLAADDLALLDWVQIGRTDDNAGIAALTVEAAPFRPVADVVATVVVRNFARAPRSVHLAARVGDVPWVERTLALEGRGAATVRLTRPPVPGVLTVGLDGDDALPADDVARAWLPAPTALDVLVVSDGGGLPVALGELARDVEGARIATMSSAAYGSDAAATRARVVVFDAVAPDVRGDASALFVAPPPGSVPCPAVARVRDAAVVDWEPAHPLLSGLGSLASLGVASASALGDVPWGTAVAYAASNERAFPFLVAGDHDGRRTACLAAGPSAPVASTDQLPLVLVTLAALHWLQDGAEALPLVVRTGEAVPSPVASGTPAAAGVVVAGDPAVLVAERVGAFHVGLPGAERLVLASLLDPRESDVGRDGGGEWLATVPAATVPGPRGVREYAWALAAGAALLLVLEWALWLGSVA